MMSLILSHPRVQPGDNVRSSNSLSNSVHFQGVSDLAAPLPSKQEWEWGRLCSRDHHPPFVRCFEILTNIFIVARLSFAGWRQFMFLLNAILHFVISPVNYVGPAAAREVDQRRRSRSNRQAEDNHRGQEKLPKRHSSAQVIISQVIPTLIHVFFCNLCFVLTNIVPARGMSLLHPPHECQALLRSPKLASPLPFPEV